MTKRNLFKKQKPGKPHPHAIFRVSFWCARRDLNLKIRVLSNLIKSKKISLHAGFKALNFHGVSLNHIKSDYNNDQIMTKKQAAGPGSLPLQINPLLPSLTHLRFWLSMSNYKPDLHRLSLMPLRHPPG